MSRNMQENLTLSFKLEGYVPNGNWAILSSSSHLVVLKLMVENTKFGRP
uniref:Uncharacterized protein n=1 Tax=Anguilla anguilla TaxID=7936 RepID=A0A0E9TBD5_ANGAN